MLPFSAMNLFATGFPGFIARVLLPEVVRGGVFRHVILLVEGRFRKQARRLAAQLFPDHPVQLVVGDITQPELGIEDSTAVARLRDEPAQWWHLAALYRLETAWEPAYRVNVEGTRNVVALASRSPVERFHYISTAYVSGNLTGRILEDDLPPPRPENFKNNYEHSKNQAEWVVRSEMGRIPTVIYRFAVVTGHSKTGETAKFDGPFFVIKYLDRWGGLPLPMIGSMECPINIVPIDYAVAAAVAISRRRQSAGTCFQIVDPDPVPTREMFELVSRALGHGPPRWRISAEGMDRMMRYSLVRRLVGIPREAMAYINHPVEYDCSNTLEALEGTGIECPDLRTYLPNLVRFYQENQHRRELHIEVT